ncbi:MAG: TRAP transporter substrate-binding protein [Succinivibrio sp.]
MKLSAAILAAAAAILAALPAQAFGQPRALPSVTFTSVMEDSPFKPISYALNYMADLVYQRTGGKFAISRRMSYGGQASSDCLVKLVVNTDDITVVPLEIVGNYLPWVRLMTLPYLFSPRDYDEMVQNGSSGSELCREISSNDTRIIALNIWYTDYLQLLMRDHPVERPEDLRGQNIWMPNAGPLSEYFASMGANPVIMPMNSAKDAVRRGLIDGMVTPINSLAVRNQAIDHMRFISLLSMSRGGYAVLVSQQKFEALPKEYQDVLRKAADDAGSFLTDFNEECAHVVMGRLRRNPALTIGAPDLTQFRSNADRIRIIYLKRYPQAAERLRNLLYGKEGQAGR